MGRDVDAVMVYEHDTNWSFLRLEGDVRYGVLDRAEVALHQRDDLGELIEKAEDQGDGTSTLALGTVTVEEGRFQDLKVEA